MKAIVNFFLRNIDSRDTYLRLKAKALVTLLLLVSALLSILILIILIISGLDKILNIALSLTAIGGTLLVIRAGAYRLASDGLTVVLMGIILLSMFVTRKYPDPYYFFVHFYLLLTFIVFAALFAQRKVFLGTVVAVVLSALIVFQLRKHLIPEDLRGLTLYGMIIYNTAVLIVSFTSYLFSTFLEKAMHDIRRSYEKGQNQSRFAAQLARSMELNVSTLNQTGHQLSSTAQELMRRASEQASTTEEVAAAMEMLLEQIANNTHNAEATYRINQQTEETLLNNMQVLRKTVELVNHITHEVQAIGSVSAQTDILAINSAIEAARSGQAGKAFMVIAAEIRTLAEHTKTASARARQLARQGREHAESATALLQSLAPQVSQSLEMMQQVVEASKEQKIGAQSISIAMQQLADVTNENSAASEEISASGEQLASQAEELHELMAKVGQEFVVGQQPSSSV